jgi:hypothetical protein
MASGNPGAVHDEQHDRDRQIILGSGITVLALESS